MNKMSFEELVDKLASFKWDGSLDQADQFSKLIIELLSLYASLQQENENLNSRVSKFDKVIREICTTLHLCYGGVDFDNGEIVKSIMELKNDISDYEFIVEQVSKVYMHITGDKLSKPNYYADVVIAVADDEITAGWEEYLKVETEELQQANTQLEEKVKVLAEENKKKEEKLNIIRGIVYRFVNSVPQIKKYLDSESLDILESFKNDGQSDKEVRT